MSPDHLRREIASAFRVVKERSTNDEVYVVCPVDGCGDSTGNRSINVKTLYSHCFRCAKPPNHVKGLFRLIGLDFEDNTILAPDELRDILRGKVKEALTPVQNIPLPDGFQALADNRDSCYWKFCKTMAEEKNLGIEDLEGAGAGFTRTDIWEPYCIFPVMEGPRTVYYQGRTYNDEGFTSTKRFPNKKTVPYGHSYWIYNIDALSRESIELVVVVESILNVLSLRRMLTLGKLDDLIVPVCIFTHRLSRAQIIKMTRYRHVKEWCLLFDSDSTDMAKEAAVAASSVLNVSVATMPHGVNPDGSERKTNDANDDVLSALRAVESRVKPNSLWLNSMMNRNSDKVRQKLPFAAKVNW